MRSGTHSVLACALAMSIAGFMAAGRAAAQCVTPTDGMVITTDTLFCPGVYHLPSGFSIAASHVTVTGDNTEIYGDDSGNGVTVDSQDYVTLRNLTIRHYYNGVHFRTCDNATIEYCTVADTFNDCLAQPCNFLDIFDVPEGSGNSYGHALWLRYCDNAVIRYNQVGNQQNGISLFDCQYGLVEYNDASNNNGWGITLYNSDFCTIQHNTADDCIRIGSGHLGGDAAALLMVMGSSDNQILDNSFKRGGDGLFLAGYRTQKLPCANNYFARNDCSDSPNNGFEATFSYGNVFEDNISDRCNYGYWLGYSWLTEVRHNQINDCFTAGVAIEHGNNNIIQDNEMARNYRGIYLWTDLDSDLVGVFPELKDSHTYTISGNRIRNGSYGIVCEATGANRYSYDYTITGNWIDENGWGVYFSATTASLLRDNFVRNNTTNGVRLITNSSSNTVYNNYLYNTANAYASQSNTWNTTKTPGLNIVSGSYLGGNFWSDYAGIDTDGDGLGDTLVPHTSGGGILIGGDYLPLVWTDPDCNLNGVPDASEPDCNQNGEPDECDISGGVSMDCNENGVPDECDISAGTSQDTNLDGIPDECQDCNGNGVPDPVDISGGTSADCNGNGRPDECEIAAGESQDCNGNGVPDACDISSGTSADFCPDGIPDECETGLGATGVVGTYYNNDNFTGLTHTRLDPRVYFLWGYVPPWPDFGADTYSVRWRGLVQTTTAGTYNFYTFTDDGARLWVNGRQLIDQWVVQGPTEAAGSITLNANTYYSIVMEYFENSGGASASLSWQPPGGAKEVIPAARLRPARDCDGNGVLDWCDVEQGAAPDCNGNGVPDACDIADGVSADDDGDGIPDECTDCNGNGTPDWQDIAEGTSSDCNGNGIPDECEPDCNGNGRPDDCDLAPQVDFHPPVLYSSVPATGWMALGDLNGDLFNDLAIATSSAALPLHILYNDQSGYFQTSGTAGPAAAEHSVALADFDHDGWTDIAIAENTARRVRILRNMANGQFTQIHVTTTTADPVSLATADVDNDQDIDLVCGMWANFVMVLKNNGNGTFGAPQNNTISGTAYVAVTGDVDGDNDEDIAVANLTNVVVLRNNGNGTFGNITTHTAGGSAACVVLRDLDGDGDLDIAAANEHHDKVSIFLNNGAGTFGAAVHYAVGPNSRFLAAGDLDLDGDIDIVTANNAAARLSVLPNNGDATFATAVDVNIPAAAGFVAAGPLDDNASPDLVASQSGSGIVVLLNAALPASPDCNANGTPDECDIADGTSTDFNQNGVPDECDGLGDMNCNGQVGFDDINPFVGYVVDCDAWQAAYPGCPAVHGDIDGDGQHACNGYPFDDINGFVALLTN